MSFDPTDPGPVLETYDPRWEARFDAAHARLKALQERGWPLYDHDLAVQLTKELTDAHEAHYKHLWQYDAAQQGHFSLGPRSVDPALRIPSPPHTASLAQVRAHYAKWREDWKYRRFIAHLPPAAEWETGVFARTPPVGVTRTVHEATIDAPLMWMPLRMTLVVEHHPGTTHVCAVQGPEDWASVTNNLDRVTGWIAERYLPCPGPLSRLCSRLRGEPTPRLMFYYTYTPTPHGPPQQLVWGHELRWARRLGRKGLQRDDLETQQTTHVLRDLSLELAPEARSGMTLH